MKRILRNKATNEYLSADGKWGMDFSSAQAFESVEAAVGEIQRLHLENAELVLVMGQKPSERFDVVLPLFATK
jgi:hypothetical protein